jgi:predicted amidohydrolase
MALENTLNLAVDNLDYPAGLGYIGTRQPAFVSNGWVVRNPRPVGRRGVHRQPKLPMTRFEKEEWFVSPGEKFRKFETDFGRMAAAVCYDVEFPEPARAAGPAGYSYSDRPQLHRRPPGVLAVRYCAHARAIENQMCVVHSGTVGSLPMVPAVSLNYGQAVILTPSDFAFARDGILAEGNPNQEMLVIGELNLNTIVESRTSGTVLPLHDSKESANRVTKAEIVRL